MSFSLKAVAKHSACLLPPASRPPHHVAPSEDLKRCSRRGNAGWRNWKKIIPTCPCWQGLTPTWWNTPSSCLWEHASSCEWLLRFRACKVGCRMITWPECFIGLWYAYWFWCTLFPFHQHRHLLPQSGGGRSEEDHQFTARADRKCKTSLAVCRYIFSPFNDSVNQWKGSVWWIRFIFFLFHVVPRRERIRSSWSLGFSLFTSKNEPPPGDSQVRSVFVAASKCFRLLTAE